MSDHAELDVPVVSPADLDPPRRIRLRAREAAAAAGISEAEWLAHQVGAGAVRLAAPYGPLVEALPTLGRVMSLTRNAAAVIEKEGVYENVELGPHASLVLGADIDLRLFLGQWASGFAAPVDGPRGPRHSLQFFDAAGVAVHKVYLPLSPSADAMGAYGALVARFAEPDQRPGGLRVRPRAPAAPLLPDASALLEGWRALTDTHQFFGLLRRARATAGQAFALAAGEFTRAVPVDAIDVLLKAAQVCSTPLMVFVGNPGCIQIVSAPVRRVVPTGGWINVLDAGYNLHVQRAAVASAFVVRKPTADGDVRSLELLDAEGDVLLRVFGVRKPGQPEDRAWTALVEGVGEGPGMPG